MNVWLDLVDDAGVVPPFRGEVVLKVSRISLGSAAGTTPIGPGVSQQQTQQSGSSSSSPRGRARDEEQGQRQSVGAAQESSPRMTVPERRGSEKLLSFDTFDESSTTPPTCECPFLWHMCSMN